MHGLRSFLEAGCPSLLDKQKRTNIVFDYGKKYNR